MENLLIGASVPAIVAVVYWLVNLIKYTTRYNENLLTYIPLISAALGVICGVVSFFLIPNIMPTENVVVAAILGGASGLSATGFNQIIKQIQKKNGDSRK